MKHLVLFALLLASPALAQDAAVEAVTVNATHPLVGIWKLAWPQWGRIPGNRWGPTGDRYCRIAQRRDDLAIHCLARGGGPSSIQNGTVSLDEDQVHFAWGNLFARIAMDGTLHSPADITGKMWVRIAGFHRENPTSLQATKLVLADEASEPGENTALLHGAFEQLARGPLSLPHDKDAIEKNGGAIPDDLGKMGALQSIVYLGSSFRELPTSVAGVPDVDLDAFHVYAVTFDAGQRLCGLHQRDDGVLDMFHCV